MRRRRLLVLFCLIAAAALTYFLVVRREPRGSGPDIAPTFAFDGDSSALQHTQIVATLDTPMQKGKNVIWCASFQAAWKKLQSGLAGGPVKLEGAPALAEALNQAYTPGREIPAGALYTAVGREDKGILGQIRKDVAQQFPGSESPAFPGIVPGLFVAYSHLEARVRFGIPYFQSTKPLEFVGSEGKKVGVASFGVREEDEYAYKELRKQPKVLYSNTGGIRPRDPPPPEYVVDLDRASEPSQIIVAMVPRESALEDTLAAVEQKIASPSAAYDHPGIGINDWLIVPDAVYRLTHRFAELEGRKLQNPALKGQSMDVAQEDITFRLDRSGAELRAESKMYVMPAAVHYLFDRPFLIIMRQRGETRPYFMMWVDNAELLRPVK